MVKITIDVQRCKGCYLCVDVCPKHVLDISAVLNKKGVKPVMVKNGSDCIGCRSCTAMCPDCCIEIEKE